MITTENISQESCFFDCCSCLYLCHPIIWLYSVIIGLIFVESLWTNFILTSLLEFSKQQRKAFYISFLVILWTVPFGVLVTVEGSRKHDPVTVVPCQQPDLCFLMNSQQAASLKTISWGLQLISFREFLAWANTVYPWICTTESSSKHSGTFPIWDKSDSLQFLLGSSWSQKLSCWKRKQHLLSTLGN